MGRVEEEEDMSEESIIEELSSRDPHAIGDADDQFTMSEYMRFLESKRRAHVDSGFIAV